MNDNYNYTTRQDNENIYQTIKRKDNYFLHILLFVLTFLSVTLGGVFWAGQDPFQLLNFTSGLLYAVLIITVISFHEFGHYFAAKIHKVDVTLPYYIPFPFIMLNPFGTMGAVIRMKSPAYDRKALFDIAIAGPIAGWIVSVIFLIIGFLTLPSIDYLYSIHPEYETEGVKVGGFSFGYNIVFWILEKTLTSSPGVFMPPMNEVYHYPFLCVGWFGLLITALNMMPVGQLDGGHIAYAMFGKNHKWLAYTTFGLLLFFGLLGLLPFFGINSSVGSVNWLLWVILIALIIKIKHPDTITNFHEPLTKGRIILGWISYLIFIISFCPVPFTGDF